MAKAGKLTAEDFIARLKGLPGWTVEDGKWIVRRYRFAEFMAGVDFVGRVARIAEDNNHHPMIAIDYKLVTVRFTTWSAGGLTDLDFHTAALVEQAYGEHA
ncbi:4a-hydroxytetrahydrobiopterin dehydratase [Paenibacillus hexagrammi]|uniref:4a-hydroxytetrahydrobiopterin dehydratase n=1 Tax=Paenibacillus hexagrammi TaxID=2908839 RepID=A0ABY3SHR6_9BACL|nr:4a-hydroxytetrahydrobiopterin dehydratase [Paenibacillus sp. YPD9-1]UJF33593.1 4a-hydroxytetrahydrobiopterin dehydratase [Paenibacillus sp. YPD9-1]